MSKLLINERPLMVLPSLATAIGLNEAMILQQIHYWIEGNQERGSERHHKQGHWWTYSSLAEWQEQFPWWSESTIKRALANLREQGLIVVEQLSENVWDKTNWYRVDYDALGDLEPDENGRSDQSDQSETTDQVRMTRSTGAGCTDQRGQVDPVYIKEAETITETSTEKRAQAPAPARDPVDQSDLTPTQKIAPLKRAFERIIGRMPTQHDISDIRTVQADYDIPIIEEAFQEVARRIHAGSRIARPVAYAKHIANDLSNGNGGHYGSHSNGHKTTKKPVDGWHPGLIQEYTVPEGWTPDAAAIDAIDRRA